MKLYQILYLMLLVLGHSLFAQDYKLEKEERIEREKVPNQAILAIDDSFPNQNVKWFLEQSDSGQSYEAKFRLGGHLFSVEFSEAGVLQDTEIKVSLKELDTMVRTNLLTFFEENYSKYKIHKIQLQFIQSIPEVLAYWESPAKSNLLPNFEIEYYGKSESKELWEGEFDQKGQLISKRRIVTKASDNLSY